MFSNVIDDTGEHDSLSSFRAPFLRVAIMHRIKVCIQAKH